MVNDTTVNIISDALIFRFALGILLGSYFAFWFGLRLGLSSFVGSLTWNCLEFLSLWMQDPGWRAVRLFRFWRPWGLPWIPSFNGTGTW